jgi:hypothetical protein
MQRPQPRTLLKSGEHAVLAVLELRLLILVAAVLLCFVVADLDCCNDVTHVMLRILKYVVGRTKEGSCNS